MAKENEWEVTQDRGNHAASAQRVSTVKIVIAIVGISMLVFGLICTLVSGAKLKTTAYRNAVRQYREYRDLHVEYQTVSLAIFQRELAVNGSDQKIRTYWREESKQNEVKWRKEWSDFDALVAYYSQSDARAEQLEEAIDEYGAESGRLYGIVNSIEQSAEEGRSLGVFFMVSGGVVFALGLIMVLRDLQLLGRFSRMTKYRA